MNTAKWTSELTAISDTFRAEFSHLSSDDLNWKPAVDRWSIGQNLQHLIAVNESYYPIIENIRAGTYKVPWPGRIGFMHRFFGKFILKGSGPDRRRKIKTFPIWQPGKSELPGDILQHFFRHQEELARSMASCSDLLEQETLISSPANRNIVYSLATAFDIMIAHERRHREQAREVRAQMNART